MRYISRIILLSLAGIFLAISSYNSFFFDNKIVMEELLEEENSESNNELELDNELIVYNNFNQLSQRSITEKNLFLKNNHTLVSSPFIQILLPPPKKVS